jgi:hypothetical protein
MAKKEPCMMSGHTTKADAQRQLDNAKRAHITGYKMRQCKQCGFYEVYKGR